MGTGVSTCTSCITDEAMNSDTEDYCTATRFLPEEVWTRIFLFLPFSDRKNANLVCRQWYDASNNIAILQHEKMIIRNMYSAPEILDMLTSSKRRFMNLDFHDIWFDDHLSSLWDACGFKIMSINFFNCVLDDENFLKAIETCENLTHLSWYYRNIGTLVPAEVKLCSDVVLRSLVEKKIIRKKLLSLRMCLDDISRIEKYTVPMMIMVFTHARKFALNFNKSDVNFHKEATESGDEITSYTILDKLVSLSDVITEVDLLLPASNNQIYSGFTCDSPEPIADLLLRFKEIPIDLSVNGSTWTNINDFCIRRKNLTDIRCTLKTEPLRTEKEVFARHFLMDVLQECPELRHLKLSIKPSWNPVEINSALFEVLLTSDLISFELHCGDLRLRLTDSRVSADEFPINITMRRLILKAGYTQHTFFIKRFQGLDYLEIHKADHKGLQTIWEYQTNLSHLYLEAVSAYTLSFTGPNAKAGETEQVFEAEKYEYLKYKQFCIDRLENLQFLNITAYESDWNASDAIFNYFVFPKLRLLQLELLDNSGVTSPMLRMIQRHPLLEVIFLRFYNDVRYESWLELCSNLKHLRILNILGSDVVEDRFTESEYIGLFNVCPTLRTVVHCHSEGSDSYYYNVIQKKVLKLEGIYLKDVLSPI